MFPGSHNFVANNCHFIDNSSSDSSIGIDILLKASSPEAAYDSSARDPPPSCFPGTREQYIEDIVLWALPSLHSDTFPPLFWVKGPAGVGKSALAQSCVEKIKDLGRPCAGFFFSINQQNKSERLFPSIAYQLSTIFPAYHDLLDQKIRRDKTLVDKALRSQFRSLLVEPIQELEKVGMGIGARVPVFIDGLDECEGANAQREIIEIIAASIRNHRTPFCWAFFSRPEPQLENTFGRPDIGSLCHTTILPISRDIDGEIELYLRANLQNILLHRTVSRELSWPSDDDIKVLVRGTGGLFIYAATILRVVSQPSSVSPEERLSEIVTAIQNSNYDSIHRTASSSLEGLDAFYMLIMERIPTDMLPVVRLFCAALCAYTAMNPYLGISAMVLSNLLRVSGPVFKSVCGQLSGVIHFQDQSHPLDHNGGIETTHSSSDYERPGLLKSPHPVTLELGGSISFYHKSFYDFLVDPARSGTFCALSPTMCGTIFNHCLDLQLDYEKSYYIQDSELVLAPGVPDSAASLSNPCNDELVNSSIKLSVYIWAGGISNEIDCLPGLEPKLRKRLCGGDYAKNLVIFRSYYKALLSRVWLWDCPGWQKDIRKTTVSWSCGDDFHHFRTATLKQVIKRRREAGLLRLCFPSFVSRLEHLFRKKSDQKRIESGLYFKGRGSKSTVWYWEINHDLQFYRDFETDDLIEGEKIFQAVPWDEVLAGNTAIDWEEVERVLNMEARKSCWQ